MTQETGATRNPQRLQRSRRKGYRIPPDAVYVGRPTKWGNPFAVGDKLYPSSPLWPYLLMTLPSAAQDQKWVFLSISDRKTAVDAYTWWLYEQPDLMLTAADELGGHDLVCWCPLTDDNGNPAPCHANILLGLANNESEL